MEPKNHWRVGRTIGRSIYIQRAEEKSKADYLIGMMDTQGLAEFVCRCVNYCLDNGIDPGKMPDQPKGEGGFMDSPYLLAEEYREDTKHIIEALSDTADTLHALAERLQ